MIKAALKKLLPKKIHAILSRFYLKAVVLPKIKKQFEGKSTKEVMTTIYTNKLWGSLEGSDFNSGSGSHNNTVINPYIEQVKKFLKQHTGKTKSLRFWLRRF